MVVDMRELLRNAWLGWNRYTDNGKFAALLFAVLLFFAILLLDGPHGNKQKEKDFFSPKMTGLFAYGALMAAACVCPLTAVLLMRYQTRFYDYEWIWNFVPTTLIIAAGGAFFLSKIWEEYSYQKKKRTILPIAVTAFVVALIFLSGSMGQDAWDDGVAEGDRAQAEEILGWLEEELGRADICLWAPKEVMECARAYSGQIRLPYGRDMWDAHLGSYSYEAYDGTRQELYQWMTRAEEIGLLQCTAEILFIDEAGEIQSAGKQVDGLLCIQNAMDMGVDCILLPESMEEEELERIEGRFAVELVDLDGYYLLMIK